MSTTINKVNRKDINLTIEEIRNRSWAIQGYKKIPPKHMGFFYSVWDSIYYIVINFKDGFAWIPFSQIEDENEKYKIGIHGLSPDMEDFILEQESHYSFLKHKFWSSFWETCAMMWSNGIDLSDKQLEIINREYNKVKMERIEKEVL